MGGDISPACSAAKRAMAGCNVERRGLRCYYFGGFLASARCVAQIARRGQGFRGTMGPAACNEAGRDEFNPRVSCYAISRLLLPPPPSSSPFPSPRSTPGRVTRVPPQAPRILSTSGRVWDYSFFPKFKPNAFSTPGARTIAISGHYSHGVHSGVVFCLCCEFQSSVDTTKLHITRIKNKKQVQVSRLEQVWRRAGDARRVWVSITLSCPAAHQTLSAAARPRSPIRTLARAQSICDRVLLYHTAPKNCLFWAKLLGGAAGLSSGGSGALTPVDGRGQVSSTRGGGSGVLCRRSP